MNYNLNKELAILATNIRIDILNAVASAGSGHVGGSLSIADILSVLYTTEMRVNPNNPKSKDRDRLVLSKGHCSPALYGVLAEKGFIKKEDLLTFRNINSILSGHAEIHVPGVDMSTGSLGQGLSAAIGIALAAKVDKLDYRTYAILGDGEIQEGQVWEAAMCAGHYKLNNLVAIIDNNNLQIDGCIENVMSSYPIGEKFAAFNWHVINVDGHNYEELQNALIEAKTIEDMPTVIVAKTIKGKGVSFMENVAGWHGKAPTIDERDIAITELEKEFSKWGVQ